VLAAVMGAVMAIVEHRQRVAIIREVERRGLVLARNLAAVSSGPLVLYNFTTLEQTVARVDEEVDVAYAIVVDRDGRVTAHSQRSDAVGSVIDDAAALRAMAAQTTLVQEVAGPAGETLYDFAAPIQVDRQRWGTARVGLSRRRMEAEIRETRFQLAGMAAVTLALGGLASALVARRIARPVRRLAEGAAAIARGELDHRIDPITSDEIGQLGAAFNDMAGQLLEQRTALLSQRAALEAAHAELRERFAELSDLKSYTDNILGSLTNGIVTSTWTGAWSRSTGSPNRCSGARWPRPAGVPPARRWPTPLSWSRSCGRRWPRGWARPSPRSCSGPEGGPCPSRLPPRSSGAATATRWARWRPCGTSPPSASSRTSSARRRRWRRWGGWPAGWPTTSTTCSR
jgi:HAMP domain-containing protein